MPLLSLGLGARCDLAKILDHLTRQSGSVVVGRGFTRRIVQRCERLASLFGTMGRDRSELRPGLRSAVFGNYVIFFRYHDDVFEVVNVLEGHRDIEAGFDDEAP